MLIELLTKKYPGMRRWLTQRLSAVVMVFYIIALILLLIIKRPDNYKDWLWFVSPWWWRFATFIFFMSLFMHAWLGVRDIMRDYVYNLTLRAYMQAVVDILLISEVVWVCYILWNI